MEVVAIVLSVSIIALVIVFIRMCIKSIKGKHKKIAPKETAQIKAAAPKEKPESKARDDMFSGLGSVPVKCKDGTIEKIPNYAYLDGEDCLVSAGGKTYHTHAGCFTHWPKEYQEGFDGWELITIEEAKARGLTKCKRCEKADERAKNNTQDIASALDELEREERESERAEREEERELYE